MSREKNSKSPKSQQKDGSASKESRGVVRESESQSELHPYIMKFQEGIFCLDCVDEALDAIWDNVSLKITEKWIRTIDVPIAVEMTMLKIKNMMAWSVTSHDGIHKANDIFEHKIPEFEPAPISIDPWARGTGQINFHHYSFYSYYSLKSNR